MWPQMHVPLILHSIRSSHCDWYCFWKKRPKKHFLGGKLNVCTLIASRKQFRTVFANLSFGPMIYHAWYLVEDWDYMRKCLACWSICSTHIADVSVPKCDPTHTVNRLYSKACVIKQTMQPASICAPLPWWHFSVFLLKAEWLTLSQANILLFGSLLIWGLAVLMWYLWGRNVCLFTFFSQLFFLVLSLLSWHISVCHCWYEVTQHPAGVTVYYWYCWVRKRRAENSAAHTTLCCFRVFCRYQTAK